MKLIHGDCLEAIKDIPDNSIDFCLTDPPYGTTACKWDSVIPFEPMWAQLKRIIKPNGAIALFGSEPFSSTLRMSNIKMFKYDWIWHKNRPVGFTNAKLKPLKSYELISIFSEGKTSNCNPNNMPYHPQGLIEVNKKGTKSDNSHGQNDYGRPSHKDYIQQFTNYPIDIISVNEKGLGKKIHPTQKPVPLLEYLIKTYTLEGETVLDFTMGSGSTGVACKNLNRDFIGIEKEPSYFEIAQERIKQSCGDASHKD